MSETNDNETVWPTPAEWANELRTTTRSQVQEMLRNHADTGNCCLGILARMAGAKTDGTYVMRVGTKIVDCTMLTNPRPHWMTGAIARRAAYLNDDAGKTFAEIADWIDAGMEVPS